MPAHWAEEIDSVSHCKSDLMIMPLRDSSAESCLQSESNIWTKRWRNQNSILIIFDGALTYWSHFRPFEIWARGIRQSRNLQSLDPGLRDYCDHKSDSKNVLSINCADCFKDKARKYLCKYRNVRMKSWLKLHYKIFN